MKKSLLLSIVALIGAAVFSTSAFALTIVQPAATSVIWGMDCDSSSSRTMPAIDAYQSFANEFDTELSHVLYNFSDQFESGANTGYASWTFTTGTGSGAKISKLGSASSSTWDPTNTTTGLIVVNTTTGSADTTTLRVANFANAAGGSLATTDGYRLPGQGLRTSGSQTTDCTDTMCLATVAITVSYTVGNDHYECMTSTDVLLGTSDSQPDLCHTTLKYPYVVNNNDDSNWVSVVVVTSNSSTCEDTEADSVDFYAWDEGGHYKGKRGPYILGRVGFAGGQVVIVVSSSDAGDSNDWNETAEAVEGSGFSNGWWNLDADGTPTTWKTWTNADDAVTGRGQIVALINQNYAEGWSAIFRLDSDGNIVDAGATLALKDLTSYANAQDQNDTVNAYIYSVIYARTNAMSAWNSAANGNFGWSTVFGDTDYTNNSGIVKVGSNGEKSRGTRGIGTGYTH